MAKIRDSANYSWAGLVWRLVFLAVVLAPWTALGSVVYGALVEPLANRQSPMLSAERQSLERALRARLTEVRRTARAWGERPEGAGAQLEPWFEAVAVWRDGNALLLAGQWPGSLWLPGTPDELLADTRERWLVADGTLTLLLRTREPLLLRVSMPWLWQALHAGRYPACAFSGAEVVACSEPLAWRVAAALWASADRRSERWTTVPLGAGQDSPLAAVSLAPAQLPPLWPRLLESPARERFAAGALLWLGSVLLLIRSRPRRTQRQAPPLPLVATAGSR